MNDIYVIVGINEDGAFNTKDGKRLIPVLLANYNDDNDSLFSHWDSVYMLSTSIDLNARYVPFYEKNKDGSYRRKFRKEN